MAVLDVVHGKLPFVVFLFLGEVVFGKGLLQKFLGYGFYTGKKGFTLRVHAKSKAKMKARVRELTSRKPVNDYEKWKVDLKRYVVGWVNYYKLADMGKYLQSVDEWMCRRIRMVFWKKWKRVRTRWRNLLRLGISNANAGILANSRKGYWRIASSPILQTVLSNQRLEKAGFQFFCSYYPKSVAA